MDSNNTLLALQAANGLLALAAHAMEAAQSINSTLAAAHAAGRTVTDDELSAATEARKQSANKLLELLGA